MVKFIDPLTVYERRGLPWVGDVPLGAVSLQLLDQAPRSLFRNVIAVGRRPPFGPDPSVDGVVEPRIEAFELQSSASVGAAKIRLGTSAGGWAYPAVARIRYRFVLYDRDGATIGSCVIIGDATMLMLWNFFEPRRFRGEPPDFPFRVFRGRCLRRLHVVLQSA